MRADNVTNINANISEHYYIFSAMSSEISTFSFHCETKPFRWHIWMQNPAQNEVSNIKFFSSKTFLMHPSLSTHGSHTTICDHPTHPKTNCKFFERSKFLPQIHFWKIDCLTRLNQRLGGPRKS